MKRRMGLVVMVLGLFASTLSVQPARAASYGAPWKTSITIQNIGAAATAFTIRLYPEGSGTPIEYASPGELEVLASTSVPVGMIVGANPFYGSATVTSGVPLAITMVQFAAGQPNRPISNGIATSADPLVQVLPLVIQSLTSQQIAAASMGIKKMRPLADHEQPPAVSLSDSQATGSIAVLPNILKNSYGYGTTSIFAVQNASPNPIDVSLRLFGYGALIPSTWAGGNALPPWSGMVFDMGQFVDQSIGSTYSGFVVVDAYLAGTSTGAPVTAVTLDLSTTSNNSFAYESSITGYIYNAPREQAISSHSSASEGGPNDDTPIYMPSALCKYSAAEYSTSYMVVSLNSSTTFSVEYQSTDGTRIGARSYSAYMNNRVNVSACADLPVGGTGSAIIRRTAGTGILLAVSKVSGGGVSAAAAGFTSGSAQIALPYVRWSNSTNYNSGARQRTSIAIQNIGTTPATNVQIHYIDREGVIQGTHSVGALPPGGKIQLKSIE